MPTKHTLAATAAALLTLGAAGAAQAATPAATAGKTLFVATCGSCHTFKPAKTAGKIGPDLTYSHHGLSSIVNQVTYGGDGMPAFKALGKTKINQIANYLWTQTGKSAGGGDE